LHRCRNKDTPDQLTQRAKKCKPAGILQSNVISPRFTHAHNCSAHHRMPLELCKDDYLAAARASLPNRLYERYCKYSYNFWRLLL
jgi:hypothetical protein